jgi:hypothetical protein
MVESADRNVRAARTEAVPPLVRVLCPLLFCFRLYLTVDSKMQNRTETLGIGSRAPEFSLMAANRQERFSLSELRKRGAVIVEFLRGTW